MGMTCEEFLNPRRAFVPVISGPVARLGLEASSSSPHSPAGRDDSPVLPVGRSIAEGADIE